MNEAIVTNSNIYKFQQQHKFNNYQELFQWSIKNRADFWRDAIAAVDIKFVEPFSEVLDISNGIAMPQWLLGAKYNIVASCFKAVPQKSAIIYQAANGEIRNITYGALHALTNRVSNSLKSLGFEVGSVIAIDMLMTAEAVAIYLGIIQAGYIAVGIADSFASIEVTKRLQISNAKLLFTQDAIMRDGKQLDMYAKLSEIDIPMVVLPGVSEKTTCELRSEDYKWQDFLLDNENFTPVAAKPHDPIGILFSSGTTGDPKAIVWDHTSPIKAAVDGYFFQDIQEQDIIAWPTSLGWMMGPWLVFAGLINQATVALYYDVASSRKFTKFVAAAKVSILGVVPSLVKAWRMASALDGLDWSHIKLITSTGETSNELDMTYLMQETGGKPIIEYCGGTEISGAYVTSTILQEILPATFNTPTLGLDILLLNDDNKIDDNGEVAILAPSIGLSRVLLNRDNFNEYYARMPEGNNGTLLRRHGDQMARLPNGYYKSLGRADDAMNLGGIKISAAEIEQCFLDVEDIIEAVAVGKNNLDAPVELVVFVVLIDPKRTDLNKLQQQMQDAINANLNPLFKISEVKVIDSIPRTSSNKIMRRSLRALL